MAPNRNRTLWFSSLFLTVTFTFAFVVPNEIVHSNHPFSNLSRILQSKTRSNTLYAAPEESRNDGESSSFDVDAVRKQLESLLVSDEEDDSSSTKKNKKDDFELDVFLSLSIESKENITLPPPPPLSSIERDRRLAEITVLKGLNEQDDASELWTLWYSERGATAKSQLEKADSLMGNPESWKECEKGLKALIDEYGVYFVEPLNRLATLYFLQNEFDKSYNLCLLILKIKPWHFGALSGIVQVCIGRGDRNGARFWAEQRLPNAVSGKSFPPFSEDGPMNPRRQEWVEEQVNLAEKMLKKAERETKISFGEKDTYHQDIRENKSSLTDDEDESAWQ